VDRHDVTERFSVYFGDLILYKETFRRRCFLRLPLEKPPDSTFSSGLTSNSHIHERSFNVDLPEPA